MWPCLACPPRNSPARDETRALPPGARPVYPQPVKLYQLAGLRADHCVSISVRRWLLRCSPAPGIAWIAHVTVMPVAPPQFSPVIAPRHQWNIPQVNRVKAGHQPYLFNNHRRFLGGRCVTPLTCSLDCLCLQHQHTNQLGRPLSQDLLSAR